MYEIDRLWDEKKKGNQKNNCFPRARAYTFQLENVNTLKCSAIDVHNSCMQLIDLYSSN